MRGLMSVFFFFSSRRRHTRCGRDWSSDVCSSDLGRDIAGACGRFYDATGEEATPDTDDGVRVYHLGQPELDADVAVARKLDVGAGAFTFVKKGSGAALCRLYSVILAMHGVEVKGVAAPEPDIF